MLRIKNEARWIERVIRSILPVCQCVYILDDNSTDGTIEICEKLISESGGIVLYKSKASTVDEARDKNVLLGMIMDQVPQEYLAGRLDSPYWVLAIDGDEVLPAQYHHVLQNFCATRYHAGKLHIKYLWDSENQVRVDGIYRNFLRPSLFRLYHRNYTFQQTPFGNGKNLHCSSVPQEMLAQAVGIAVALNHYGYLHKEDRLRKYAYYNEIDPHDEAEDGYRHMVIGDLFPADSKFRHAGPLELKKI
jgi:glycosyltransferase involved in cell wall biosynthesis